MMMMVMALAMTLAYKDDKDKEDIEFLSRYVCAICGRKLFPCFARIHKVADLFLCEYCFASDEK